MLGFDCLLQVNAIFYDIGDKVDYLGLDDFDFGSYGAIDSEQEKECLADIPSDNDIALYEEDVKRSGEDPDYDWCNRIEKPLATASKPFTLFNVSIIGMGDFDDHYGCGIMSEIENVGIFETFEPLIEDITDHAHVVRKVCNDSRQRKAELKFQKEFKPTKNIRFVLAMEYWAAQDYWGEWDSGINILGIVTKEDIVTLFQKKKEQT